MGAVTQYVEFSPVPASFAGQGTSHAIWPSAVAQKVDCALGGDEAAQREDKATHVCWLDLGERGGAGDSGRSVSRLSNCCAFQ